MANGNFDWAIPVMRTGYAGRALVYVCVAGISLFSLLRGGEAQGTSSALERIEQTSWGTVILVAIFVGMLAYAIWRLIDAAFDLECYGSDGEGTVARIGMVTTGIIHAAIGVGALLIAFAGGGGGGQSSIAQAAEWVLGLPGGRWILGIAGLLTLGAGGYYIKKGWKREYRKSLMGNPVTRNMDGALAFGVMSQGFVVGVIGAFLIYAAWSHNPNEAGGMGQAFSWLSGQPYGQVLVGALCIGLLGFALFCAVNARYRIVQRASDPDEIQTLGARIEAKAKQAGS